MNLFDQKYSVHVSFYPNQRKCINLFVFFVDLILIRLSDGGSPPILTGRQKSNRTLLNLRTLIRYSLFNILYTNYNLNILAILAIMAKI